MTYAEMDNAIGDFIEEYYCVGKYKYLNGEDGLRRPTREETEDYRRRLKAFFAENDVPEGIMKRFRDSGVGSSYYMAHERSILE